MKSDLRNTNSRRGIPGSIPHEFM